MTILIKILLFANVLLFRANPAEYKYTLICTGKNCTPCITTAESFFSKTKALPTIINLYSSEADKQITKELIDDYCNQSDSRKKVIKNSFVFGRFIFKASDNGPFLIKYSKTDTVIFDARNIDEVN